MSLEYNNNTEYSLYEGENTLLELDDLIKHNPVLGYSQKGFYFQSLGDYKKALECFFEIENYTDDAFYYSDVAACYRYMGEVDKALYYMEKDIEVNSGTSCVDLAGYLEELGRYEEAVEHYLKECEDDDAFLIEKIARCYEKINAPQAAISYYQKLSKTMPVRGKILEGSYLVRLERYEEALIAFGLAEKQYENSSEYAAVGDISEMYYLMAVCSMNLGYDENVNKYKNKMIETIEKGDTDNYCKAGYFIKYKLYDKALKYLKNVEQDCLNGDETSIDWIAQSEIMCYQELEDVDSAVDFCNVVTDFSPAVGNYYKAMILINQNNFDKALKLLKIAENSNYTNQENLYDSLFFCNIHLDDNENAMIYADKLVELNPAEGYLRKAAVFNRVDNCEEALKYLFAARECGSEHPDLERRIDELKCKIGDEEAFRLEQKVINQKI